MSESADLNLTVPPKIPFHRRWRRTEKELVISSLAPSINLLQQASSWSSRTGSREGVCTMEFKLGWWSGQCLVYQWYEDQQRRSHDQGSSTHFTSIQHCQTLDYPFFHEFLLLPLSDGSAYRVERTGVGSNAEAIGRSGCPARDMIQWLSPKQNYNTFIASETWKLVADIDLPREFEVRNVLTICYSSTKAARACEG
jgi:hypothetical protein